MRRRLAVMGLDGVPPELLFDRLLPQLPTFQRLVSRGIWGQLDSCDPPITVPAWAVMTTGRSPVELGLFGFRERRSASYTDIDVVSSASVHEPAVWDRLGQAGRRACVFAVPPGYPPAPIQGITVGCHLTPGPSSRYATPPEVQGDLESQAGPYIPDIKFRTEDRARVLDDLFDMTQQHARLQRALWRRERWDLFMRVEIGTDRAHHAFWKFSDPSHPRHLEHPRFSSAILDYYRLIDAQLDAVLADLDDDTMLLLLSDHGAQSMQGAFCLNEWLIERGYLVLRSRPAAVTPLERADVDWSRTAAWGWGGYHARMFFNVRGREPMGCVDPQDIGRLRDRLIQELGAVATPAGDPLGVTVLETGGASPADLMVYLGGLSWRAAGTVGHSGLFLDGNDTGPDDAVHSKRGIFLLYDPRRTWGQRLRQPLRLVDVAPTMLKILDHPLPAGLSGRPLEY